MAAERAASMLGGLVTDEALCATLHREPGVRHREPGHKASAVMASAHRAVAVRAEQAWKPHSEANGTAEAPTRHLFRVAHDSPRSPVSRRPGRRSPTLSQSRPRRSPVVVLARSRRSSFRETPGPHERSRIGIPEMIKIRHERGHRRSRGGVAGSRARVRSIGACSERAMSPSRRVH
jgi:hypothetical protein